MRTVGFTKRRLRRYVLGRRDQAQARLDATSGANKLALSRALGRRDAWNDLLDALDNNHVEGAGKQAYVFARTTADQEPCAVPGESE